MLILDGKYYKKYGRITHKGKIVANKVNELIDMANKTVYELKTSSGRSINTTSNHPYLVKLYSKEECDKYAQTVWNKNNSFRDDFEENGYCTRWVEVNELKDGMEIGVPKIGNNYSDSESESSSGLGLSISSSNLRNSSVLSTLTFDCLLCKFSLDHNAQSILSANAKKSTSFKCFGNMDLASPKKSVYSDSSTNSTSSGSSFISSVNSLALILDANNISSLCLFNSFNANCGDSKPISLDIAKCNNLCVGEPFQKKEYNIFVSTTNFSPIQINPCLLSCFNLSSLTLALNLSTSSSVNSLFFNISSNLLNASSLLSLLRNASLATFDQLTQEKCSMSALSESSNDAIMLAIYNSPLCSSSNFLSNSTLLANALLNTSAQLISGCLSNLAFNSSGIDTVIVAMLPPQHNSINTQKSVDIYKSFDSDTAFEKITLIKELDEQHVYDLNIENTHNFIANDIIAHNTGTDSATTIQYSFGTFPNISVNTSGLIGLWHFNNESVYGENATGGNGDRVYDFSKDVNTEDERANSAHYNGTTQNGATINKTIYKLGGCAGEFDGVNDNVLLPNIPEFEGVSKMTISVWVNPDTRGDFEIMIFDDRVEVESPGKLPHGVTLKNLLYDIGYIEKWSILT